MSQSPIVPPMTSDPNRLVSDDDLYLIQDSRSYVGNSILWWRPDGQGYTIDFDDAGRYTKERAFSQHRSRKTDVPWKLSEIAPLVGPRPIDAQRLPRAVHVQSRSVSVQYGKAKAKVHE